MGAWGAGLYSSDDALDLRAAIASVSRLPHDGSRLIEILSDLDPDSRDKTSEGHATFWLVVADQFHRRGIDSVARERALTIIADGSDLAMLAKLGMNESGLRERRRVLDKLADALRSPAPPKPRKVLKKPQPLLFQPGDILTFPVDAQGNCCNPYFPDAASARFVPVGWDGCVILSCGRALEYFAWYAAGTTKAPWRKRPSLGQVIEALVPDPEPGLGTLSKAHAARMGLELLGNAPSRRTAPPPDKSLIAVTAEDISVSNALSRYEADGDLKFR